MRARNGQVGVSETLKALLKEGRRSLDEDWSMPAKVFNDPEIHALERERIFGRAWTFLGHETEIEHPGDYVTRQIAEDQFILIRDEQGEIRAHFNACRHRSMQVCRAEMGNASHFRCPYHGWTYKNDGRLIGVPAGKEAYGGKLEKADWGLRSMPQLDTYQGLIFGSLDPEAPPLDEYLGDMRFYLDLVAGRTDGGLEIVGAPQRWIVDANWKLGADNFIGDAYHTMMTHRSMVELGLAPPDAQFGMYGEHVYAGNGHGLGLIAQPPGLPLPPFLGLPDEVIEQMQRRFEPGQLEIMRRTSFIHGTVFPNFSILNVFLGKDHVSPPIPILTLRLWQPLGPDRMELWSWFAVDRDAPDWYKQESYECYVHTFGISGVFEQDDTENWRSITRVVGGQFARGQHVNYQMGRDHLEPDENWPGPGEAYPMDYAEHNQRAFHHRWLDYMTDDFSSPDGYRAHTNGSAAEVTPTTTTEAAT